MKARSRGMTYNDYVEKQLCAISVEEICIFTRRLLLISVAIFFTRRRRADWRAM